MATPIGDNVVVVDYDDDFFKAGYCIPERDPQVVLPTAVRRPGDGAETFRPIASRRVQDWDQLESLYAHAFYRQLGWVEGDEGAVLVSEPLFTSRADRERLAQTLFESFNVSGLYVAEQPVLALYGLGKTSGVSVDVGYAVTDVAPVVDGAVVAAAARRTDVGKRDVAAALGGLLGETGARLSEARLDAARDAACVVDARARERLRDGTCTTNTHDGFVFDDFDTNGTDDDREPRVRVHDIDARLPDGTMVTVPARARRACAEAVFFPARFAALAGDALKFGHSVHSVWTHEGKRETYGVSDALAAAVHACAPEQRLACLDAVAVHGGWAGAAWRGGGFEARVLGDLADALPPSARPMGAGAPEHMPASAGMHAAWFGGALLGKMVFAQNHHVTRFEYHENGPGAVTKRF